MDRIKKIQVSDIDIRLLHYVVESMGVSGTLVGYERNTTYTVVYLGPGLNPRRYVLPNTDEIQVLDLPSDFLPYLS